MRTIHTLTKRFPITEREERHHRPSEMRKEFNEVVVQIAEENPNSPHTAISITADHIRVSKISNGKTEQLGRGFTIQELIDIATSEKRIVYMVKP